MNNYIIEAMTQVGCGVSDTKEIASIVDTLSTKQKDILDGWHNLGKNIPLKGEYQEISQELNSQFSDDDIECLSAYVNASRNVN